MARKRYEKIYNYSCTLTGEEFKVTKETKNTDDLISVKAYYDMNPEKDDRPEHVKIQLESSEE